jgi:transcriptional regulator with XRE-family HTH domain
VQSREVCASVASVQTGNDHSGLGARLKSLRVSRGLSMRALGERLGITSAHVSNIEGGKRHFTTKVAADWLTACGVQNDDVALALDLLLVLGLADETLKRSLHAQFASLLRDLSQGREGPRPQ